MLYKDAKNRQLKGFSIMANLKMLKVQFSVLFLLLVVADVFGAVFRFPILTEEVYGKTVKFCKYKDVRMLPNSEFKDYDDCTKCECTQKGGICTTLSSASTITVPEDSKCISVLIGCKNTWVRKNNPKKKCPKGKIPTNISVAGK